MPRLAVVFDTNAYRAIGAESFERLRVDEQQHAVVPMASYVAAMELLSHLADPFDPSFMACLHATRRLGQHCSRWDGSKFNIEFMQLADAQIVSQLFGRRIAGEEIRLGGLSTIIGAIVDDPRPETALQYRDGLIQLRDGIEREEAKFAEKLWKKVVLSLAPDATDWQSVVRSPMRVPMLAAIDEGRGVELIAATIVDRAADKCGLRLDDADRADAVKNALLRFPTSIHHHNLLIRTLIDRGPDMSRADRANSLWDHEITYSTAPGATVKGLPLVLVTADPLILRAAELASTRNQVWSLNEYREVV